MNSLARIAAAILTLIVSATPLAAPAQNGDASDLLVRMARVNANLKSYTATTHVDIALHTFPFVSPALDGNYYYKQPDKSAIVFQTVPILAKQFQKIYPKLDPPSRWSAIYDVTSLGDEAGATMLRLVPKKNGRVDHLDVRVDDSTATVSSFVWTYKEGGTISFDQQFALVNGNYLVKAQNGKVDLPNYKADVTSAFTQFKVNVPIADKVFQT